jgi:geranylgeranyl reductase
LDSYDVVIIGAGPGGLSAAKVLAQNNKKVLVLEKNSIIGPKTCGGGITSKDYSLGIPKELASHFFDNVILHTPITSSSIKSKEPYVSTIDRGVLGAFMTEEAKIAGAQIRIESMVEKIDSHKVTLENGDEIAFKYLIGADGSNSIVRDFLNLKTTKRAIAFHYKIPKIFKKMELFFDANLFGAGYAWIFPHEKFTSIGCGADPNGLIPADDLKTNFEKWLIKNKIDKTKAEFEAWNINYDYRGHEFGHIFLAGDAAGFTSGLTGEGIFYAMVSGEEIARKIIDPTYKQKYLKKILKIKAQQEKLLAKLNKSKMQTQLLYNAAGLVFKTGLANKKLIKSYG